MEFDEQAEEAEFQNLRSNLRLFGSPDSVERCKDGPGFFLVHWVGLHVSTKQTRWSEDPEFFETIEELVVATNAAINKRANDKFVAAAEERERDRKRW